MAENSNISWTDATFNGWIGCTRVSPGCDNCYAADHAKKKEPLVKWGEAGQAPTYRRTVESNWRKPLAWNRAAVKSGESLRVFCSSLADVFDNHVPADWRRELFGLIAATPALDWLLLTKRPQNIRKMLPEDWRSGWANVRLGCTAENQEEYDRRRIHLLEAPSRGGYFFSVEPMLSPVIRDLAKERGKDVWYICGGESGEGRREMQLEWAESLRSSCAQTGTPFFFKQVSSYRPGARGNAPDLLWNTKQMPPRRKANWTGFLVKEMQEAML